MPALTLSLTAAGCYALAYYLYYGNTKAARIAPNRWSWLIWGFAAVTEALTYDELNKDAVKSFALFINAGGCLVVAFAVWRRAVWERPHLSELICIVLSFAALILWVVFREVAWAHYLVVAAVPIAFIPMWHDVYRDPKTESYVPWAIWTIGDALMLILIWLRYEGPDELPYLVAEFVCHAAVAMLVIIGLARTRSK